MSAESPCECPSAGFCPRYQIEQNEHTYGICSGKGTATHPCTPEKSESYRATWRKRLAKRMHAEGGPGLIQRAVNATKAAVRSAASGFRKASLEVIAERTALCEACEFNDKQRQRCLHPRCGCNLKRGLVTKVQVASEKCPLGLWNRV